MDLIKIRTSARQSRAWATYWFCPIGADRCKAFVPRALACVKTCYDFYLNFPMTSWGLGKLGILKNVFSSVIILNIFQRAQYPIYI
jgi:hypothetical protein